MKRTTLFLAAMSMLLLGACAMNSGHPAFAAGDEPHAVLEELRQGNVSDSRARTKLVRIDGRRVLEGERRTFYLEPGSHTLAFELDVESLRQFESGRGRNFPDPSAAAASVDEKSLEVVLQAGERYRFGATIDDFDYAGWQPFVTGVNE